MKSRFLYIFLLFLLFSLDSFSQIKVEEIPIEEVFIPKGFDNNDHVELVVSSNFPDSCYKDFETRSQIDGRKIFLKIMAQKTNDQFCAQALIPIMDTISLGVLDSGEYEVKSSSGFESRFFIEESSSSAIDESLYMNVDYVEKMKNEENKIFLRGYNPSDCYEFDEAEIVSNSENTLSILPKMKQISEFCPMKFTPFSIEVRIPEYEEFTGRDKILLHIRSMNGNAVNSFYHPF